MNPMLELLLCAAGVGVLFVLLDYRPTPSPEQARAIKERQERVELEARVKEFMMLTPADLEILHAQASEQLYIARKTNWKYHKQIRAELGICKSRRKRRM